MPSYFPLLIMSHNVNITSNANRFQEFEDYFSAKPEEVRFEVYTLLYQEEVIRRKEKSLDKNLFC